VTAPHAYVGNLGVDDLPSRNKVLRVNRTHRLRIAYSRRAPWRRSRARTNHPHPTGVILYIAQRGTRTNVDSVLPAPTIQASETALVERARHGDHEAFAALVDGRLSTTFRTALAILGNEADARDATQEIFLRAWRNLPELRESDRFGAWFGRIVVNTCRTAVRGRRRRIVREISVGALPEDGEQIASGASPHDTRTADLDLLEHALDRLSVTDRTLLALHHVEHLQLDAIGARLGVPAKTVKSRLFSARRSLERALEVERR
jgi:RNA polymerase sigma-70 factor, ECF subfamily